jgi:hypothetical protein
MDSCFKSNIIMFFFIGFYYICLECSTDFVVAPTISKIWSVQKGPTPKMFYLNFVSSFQQFCEIKSLELWSGSVKSICDS